MQNLGGNFVGGVTFLWTYEIQRMDHRRWPEMKKAPRVPVNGSRGACLPSLTSSARSNPRS
jgi:hypothetical protein